MATSSLILDAPVLVLGTTDFSAQVQKAEISLSTDEKDITTFTSGGKAIRGGLESGSLKITFINDITTDNGLDEVIWTAFKSKTAIAFSLKADDAATSSTNPAYTGSVLVNKWTPISGAVGDVLTVDADWPTSGVVTRTTA